MLDTLVTIARDAGAVILDIYRSADLGARRKDDGSSVTRADGAAEALILERLRTDWPEIPVVAEEAVSAGLTPDVGSQFFLVDPLDGTAEFIRRSGEFTVNIALIEHGRPAAGVIYLPTTGEVFRGGASGAFKAQLAADEAPAWSAIRARAAPEAGLTVITSRRSGGKALHAYLAALPVAETVRASSSLKLCRLAEGAADIYPRFGRTMAWDIAAGHAILSAAGGGVRTLDGRPLAYGPGRGVDGELFANPDFIASGAFDPADLVRRRASS